MYFVLLFFGFGLWYVAVDDGRYGFIARAGGQIGFELMINATEPERVDFMSHDK
jgi:hypothetical protein